MRAVVRALLKPILFAFAALAGVAVLIAIARHAPFTPPVGDGAVIENYVFDALAGRAQLGPYSRFVWHHPGPMYDCGRARVLRRRRAVPIGIIHVAVITGLHRVRPSPPS